MSTSTESRQGPQEAALEIEQRQRCDARGAGGLGRAKGKT
jgi:hypothetical protein